MKPWAILLPVALLSSVAIAQHVKVEAVADRTAVKPGETFTVALHFTIAPGWHLYWTNPGETGTPPKAKWQLPAGVKVGDPRFPVPHRMEGAVTAFGYEKQTTLLYAVTVPADAKSAIDLQANVGWVVCSDETCVSEKQSVALNIPIGDGQPNRAESFAAWRSAQPSRSETPLTLAGTIKPDRKHGTIELPVSSGESVVDFFPPKSDELEFTKPKAVDGKWTVDFRILTGGPDEFEGTGLMVIKNANSENTQSNEVRVTYRLPKPSSLKE